MTARPIRRVALPAVLALGLAGCAVAIPDPQPDPVPAAPVSVLSETQVDAVLAAVTETLAAADGALDGEALAARLGDPALAMRRAQYTLAERSDGARALTPLTTQDQVVVVAATDAWPRTVMAVTTPPEGATVPLLIVVTQAEPRAPYTMRSWVRLFPGVETPAFASPEVGSPPVPADAGGLVATPSDTVARYADLLARGSESEHAGTFESDPYSESLAESLSSSRSTLEGIADVTFGADPVEDHLVALGTADGGALVVGTVITTTTYTKTLEGATLTLRGEVGEWLGDGDVPTSATATHLSTVAFYVPVAADGATITVLGAERVLSDATKN